VRIIRFTRELTPLYIAIILCSVATAASALAVPFLIGRATDVVSGAVGGTITADAAVRSVVLLALGLLAAELAATLLNNLGGYFGDRMGNRLRTILSVRYFDKLLHRPQSWDDVERTGTIVSRLNRSIAEVSAFAKTFSNAFATMLLTTLAVLVISAYYFWPLAVLLLVIFPVYVWLTALTSKKWQRLEGEKNEQVDLAGGRFAEVIGQIRVVRSFVREKSELALFRRRFEATDQVTREQSAHWHRMDVIRRGALNLIFFAIYVIIFVLTAQGRFTLGQMVLLLQLMNMARDPVQSMSWVIDSSQRAIAGTRDYFRVMDTVEDPLTVEESRARGTGGGIIRTGPASIRFDNVHFAYEVGEDVLHDVSFEVAPGTKVALVGESGGGKSTIVNLLLGLYRPRSGRILVGGRRADEVAPQDLRRGIGVVFQDASLFSGTIEENIAYGQPEADADQIREAARRANADGFVEKFAEGYATVIGERGLKLSGGQRQRIAVARAILKDAPILVLDEATSALDTKAERQVQAGLEELMSGRTSLIIAHRLSTIAEVDLIVTLREGHVDEIGSPAELAASGGIYAELLALQDAGRTKKLARYGISG
jgi:ATP-binding cassette subfamily B protein